jgi:hypothetical protein
MSESIHILYDPVQRMICTFCHARMDVSTIAPFSKAICPSCNNEVTVPARLGSFLLTELLGTGGMGGVYRAHDEMLGRDVAIKVILKSLGDNPEFVSSFRREAQAAAKLNHPSIAQIYSFGQEKGQPYIVMELVPGMHFDQMIAAPEPLNIPLVMKIGHDIAEGLQVAADANLIHGDIKPENILLDERNQAKLVDFGIAAKPSKGEGEIWGTPYYIAPERVRRQRVDFRSDIYCLGGTLYHAITQHPPFDGADAIEVVRARLKGPPEPMEPFRPDVAPEVSAIIMRMLQAEPAMRYPTYGSLLSDMRNYLARVQPGVSASSTGRRIVIKGRKAATAAIAAKTTGSVPLTGATSRITGAIASRTRPMVITRGMFPDATPSPAAAADSAPDAKTKASGWMKGCLIAALVFAALLIAGGAGAWLFINHRNQERAARIADEQAALARRQTEIASLHSAILKGADDLARFETQANAWVTQAVALVAQELGEAHSARILEAPPDPESASDPASFPPGRDQAANAVDVATLATNALPDEDADTASHTPDLVATGAVTTVDEAADASPDGEAVPASGEVGEAVPEADLEPLPALAQMAREVFEQALPLRQALRLAQRAGHTATEIQATIRGGTNTLATLQTARQRLVTLASEIDREHAKAPQTLAATRQRLDALVREISRLAVEREKAEVDARRLEEERLAAEAEARRQAERREAIAAEIARVAATVKTQKEALLRHEYDQVLRALRALDAEIRHEEGRQALNTAIKRVTGLQELRDFLIKRLNAVPFKAFLGWSVEKAGVRTLTIRSTAGKVSEVQWDNIGIPQMVEFIKFYIQDEQQSRAVRLRERYAQTLNAIIFCLTFGEGSDDARAMIRTLGQRAADMMPTERDALLRLLPELTDMID